MWSLGALVPAASVGRDVIGRTVALPGRSGEAWMERAGILAVAAEVVVLVATLAGLRLARTVRVTASAPSLV